MHYLSKNDKIKTVRFGNLFENKLATCKALIGTRELKKNYLYTPCMTGFENDVYYVSTIKVKKELYKVFID